MTGARVEVTRAISMAMQFHAHQTDKAGQPYVLHPLRVGLSLLRYGNDAVIAGVLHDIVEDTPATIEYLDAMGVPERALAAIEAVTKVTSERGIPAYIASVERAMADPLGRYVKAADILDNWGRLPDLPDVETRERLMSKYLSVESLVRRYVSGFVLGSPLPPPPVGWVAL